MIVAKAEMEESNRDMLSTNLNLSRVECDTKLGFRGWLGNRRVLSSHSCCRHFLLRETILKMYTAMIQGTWDKSILPMPNVRRRDCAVWGEGGGTRMLLKDWTSGRSK